MAIVKLSGVLMVLCLVVGLVSVVSAIQGTATFYTHPYTPSACNGYRNDGVMIAAASDAMWNHGAACGRMYRVRCVHKAGVCRGNGVTVKIVDYCPAGCAGTIDLSQEAFAMIADPDAGKIRIEYNQV